MLPGWVRISIVTLLCWHDRYVSSFLTPQRISTHHHRWFQSENSVSELVKPTYFFASYISDEISDPSEQRKSRLLSIRSSHLAGLNQGVTIETKASDFIAVTGETGSGKSLFVAKVAQLLQGGKASSSLVGGDDQAADSSGTATVEMEFILMEPHRSAVQQFLNSQGVDDAKLLVSTDASNSVSLTLTRTLSINPNNNRLSSRCTMNGEAVTLKVLAAVASMLVTVVDSPAAASALHQPSARLALVDTGVKAVTLQTAKVAQANWQKAKRERMAIEAELASRVLPSSFDSIEDDVELMEHWIEELDEFSAKAEQFCETHGLSGTGTSSSLDATRVALMETSWMANEREEGSNQPFSSGLLECLTNFRQALSLLETQIGEAQASLDTLSLMSIPNSASVALEQARNHLVQATQTEAPESEITKAAETAHERLNEVEAALLESTRYMETNVLAPLQDARASCYCSVEAVDELMGSWYTLARKHGIAPHALPACHQTLQMERDGNVEAQVELPKALERESEALQAYTDVVIELRKERSVVAQRLSESVSQRLPDLGIPDMELQVRVENSTLFTDQIDFNLVSSGNANSLPRPLQETASAGEKARILLATECVLPGSVGACCGTSAVTENAPPPVAVIYDEIDAHVGGHAAVAVANVLVEQAKATQVVSITHAASIAARARVHILVDRNRNNYVMTKQDRLEELARMASGSLATEEARALAEALLRGASTTDASMLRNE